MTAVTITELSFVQGTSDKFYRVMTFDNELVCQYGRTGTYGTFIRKTLPTETAATAAGQKAIAGKAAKGYQITKQGALNLADTSDANLDAHATALTTGTTVAPTAPPVRPHSPVVTALTATPVTETPPLPYPMLAQVGTANEVTAMLTNNRWAMQPKLDGDRVLIQVFDGDVKVYNRQGQPKVSNISAAMLTPFRTFTTGHWIFDGEIVGRTLWLFDLPVGDTIITADNTFAERYSALSAAISALDADPTLIRLVPVAFTTGEKQAMLTDAESNHREGVIFRELEAPYRAGRSAGLVKHKFIKEVDAYVVAVNTSGKSNAVLAVNDHDGNEQIIGQVSTIGKGAINVGDVLEVSYLYIVNAAAPRLYQPRIMRRRTDKLLADCSIEQLRNAQTNKTFA